MGTNTPSDSSALSFSCPDKDEPAVPPSRPPHSEPSLELPLPVLLLEERKRAGRMVDLLGYFQRPPTVHCARRGARSSLGRRGGGARGVEQLAQEALVRRMRLAVLDLHAHAVALVADGVGAHLGVLLGQ